MPNRKTADEINAILQSRFKSRVDRIRRAARRKGLIVMKSRARNPRSTEYCGFIIADDDRNLVAGEYPHAFSMSLEDVERYLLEDRAPPGGCPAVKYRLVRLE